MENEVKEPVPPYNIIMLCRDSESLKEYILIDSENVYFQKLLRQPDNSWVLTEKKHLEEQVYFNTTALYSSC